MKSLCITAITATALASNVLAEDVSVTVVGTTNTGTVRGAIFVDQVAFDGGTTAAVAMAPANSGQTVLTFTDLAPGQYGIAVYQDLDGSEELNRNVFGAPTEPFGFSNDPKIGFSAPKFDVIEIDLSDDIQGLVITLNGV